MLSELHVENLGVIDSLTLLLGPGMTAVTGETGAGKTLVVEAIELLVGGRADPTLVRRGATEARVEGRFVLGDDEFVLSRVLPVDGRSRAYVNGRLATAALLAEHGAALVDLHGQHAHQSLLAASAQRAALDRFGSIDLGELREVRARLTAIDAALATMGGDERARARELDLLRYQLDELERAALTEADEDLALEAEEDLLANAVTWSQKASAAGDALSGDGAAVDSIRQALSLLHGPGPFSTVGERLRGLIAELDDVADELRTAAERIEFDPERLAAVRARRQLLVELRRKYGETLADVMAEHVRIAQRAEELRMHDVRAGELELEKAALLETEARCARHVRGLRAAAAPQLADAVGSHLRALAMAGASIGVEVGAEPPGDDVRFLLAANRGEPMLALAKVASGGELARAMLALRLVLTAGPPTLVFDEVDAGIGGEAAIAVGRALAELGQTHQVMVVTHLAQVAAYADRHVAVSKHESKGRTVSAARVIEGDERVDELSRMLAGRASETARAHARELLAR